MRLINMAAEVTLSVNQYNKNQYSIEFNTWPNLTNKVLPEYIFDNNVRAVTFPDVNIPLLNTQIGHTIQYSPAPIGSRQFNEVHVTFAVDDWLLNYYAARMWIDQTRYGVRKSNKELPEDYLRYNRIEQIVITNFDNKQHAVSKLSLNRVFITNVSNLILESGKSDKAEFTCTFLYESQDFDILIDIPIKQ